MPRHKNISGCACCGLTCLFCYNNVAPHNWKVVIGNLVQDDTQDCKCAEWGELVDRCADANGTYICCKDTWHFSPQAGCAWSNVCDIPNPPTISTQVYVIITYFGGEWIIRAVLSIGCATHGYGLQIADYYWEKRYDTDDPPHCLGVTDLELPYAGETEGGVAHYCLAGASTCHITAI